PTSGPVVADAGREADHLQGAGPRAADALADVQRHDGAAHRRSHACSHHQAQIRSAHRYRPALIRARSTSTARRPLPPTNFLRRWTSLLQRVTITFSIIAAVPSFRGTAPWPPTAPAPFSMHCVKADSWSRRRSTN